MTGPSVCSECPKASSPSAPPKLLSVATVNSNSRDDLAECLASLAAQSYAELEVLIVDNAQAVTIRSDNAATP
ncbi:MAG TPA: glycosyltransferase [Polyangiaceae bacterium]|nr:glycosyltransferase [Polyangiaceae bacterium]